jgi:hypothetical protein
MKGTATSGLRRVLAHRPGRTAAAAVAAVTLAGSLLTATPPAGAAVTGYAPCPVVWNGTDLVTATISVSGRLYAYDQAPGATSWTQQLVAHLAPDGEAFISASMTATSNSVQIVAVDGVGVIWFFQQIDGTSTWSDGQEVGSASLGNGEGVQFPQIAWTGVPGHTGTNSVVTIADGSGNVLFWYQNGGGWTQETVVNGSPSDEYYDADLTATDQGIVLVAPESNGEFQSFFQAYGAAGWTLDGGLDVGPGQSFDSVSATWDGTNVDVAASYTTGSAAARGNEVMFLWKSDSGIGWNHEVVMGPQKYGFYVPVITFTGSNLLLASSQEVTTSKSRLDFWWQGSTFTNFNFESVASVTTPNDVEDPELAYSAGASSPEAVIVAPVTSNLGSTFGADDWTEPVGSPIWTKHVMAPA